MRKISLFVLLVAAAGIAGLLIFTSLSGSSENSTNVLSENEPANIVNQGSPAEEEVSNSPDTKDQEPAAEEKVVTYTDGGYSPAVLKVKVGDTVVFKNASLETMRVASMNHPTHKVYPTTGGCVGSTFDACKGISPQESWSFRFDLAGSWGYHNHLHPSFAGTVIAE